MNTKRTQTSSASLSVTQCLEHQKSVLRKTALLVLLIIGLIGLSGCTKYPQVEYDGLKYIAALRTACNTRNSERLEKSATAIQQAHEDGKLDEAGKNSLFKIVELARAGNWETAEKECLRFQKDQFAR